MGWNDYGSVTRSNIKRVVLSLMILKLFSKENWQIFRFTLKVLKTAETH